MSYSDFLHVLLIIAPKVYPEALASDVFQKLLLENILPLAARRTVTSVKEFMSEGSDVHDLLYNSLSAGFFAIFSYYTNLSDRRRKKTAALDVQETSKKRGGHGQVVTTSKAVSRHLRSSKVLLGYPEYIQFCQDFKLIAMAQLTTIQAGDIYLACVGKHHGGALGGALGGDEAQDMTQDTQDMTQDMTFSSFHEMLLRMAMTAYSSISGISLLTKVKGLCLFLWKSVNNGTATTIAVNGRGGKCVCDSSKSVKSGDLNLFGCSQYNVQMLDVWKKDNFVEYLAPVATEEESGADVLKRMLGKNMKNMDMDFPKNKHNLDPAGGVSEALTPALTPAVASTTVQTRALVDLLKARPHIAALLRESLAGEGAGEI